MKTRFALKAATDDVHRELDERLSRLDLARPEDYRRFLHVQARTVPPIEAALAAGGLDELVEGWSETRRTAALQTDLAELGDNMPEPAAAPAMSSVAALLGTAYVLEGSRLGGRVLTSHVGPDLPSSFLAADGALGAWPAVVAALDRLLYSDDLIGEAKDAARQCFALFLNVAAEAGI
jgi:heme oxygenase